MNGAADVLFEARTPLGFTVRVTRERWDLITTLKHPIMAGRQEEICAVSKRTGAVGFLITAYPTNAIKEGEKIWPS